MKIHIAKDKKNRINFCKVEKNRINFLFFARNRVLLSSTFKNTIVKKKFLKLRFMSRIHNFCFLTGRSSSVFSEFKTSRMVLKEMFNRGLFPGIKKSSWLFDDQFFHKINKKCQKDFVVVVTLNRCQVTQAIL